MLCSLKKSGKLIVASVPGAAMARGPTNNNQENNLPSDAVAVKGSSEVRLSKVNSTYDSPLLITCEYLAQY